MRAEDVLRTAHDIIGQIGIELPDQGLRRRVLADLGRPSGERIVFSAEEVAGFLARWRKAGGLGPAGGLESPHHAEAGGLESPHHGEALGLSVMPYSHTYHDPSTDRLLPLTAARLVEATRLLGTFHGEGLEATVPGHPVDIPPALQPIFQYKTGAQHNPAGGGYGWLGAPRTAEYVLQMAEAMGAPIRATVVYVFSPLRLGGDELRTAVALRDRLTSVHIGNMGSCGASLPIMPGVALALSWAESIAGAMCVEVLTGLPVTWSAAIEPFDPRAQTIPFGAPEQVLYYRMAREARNWLEGRRCTDFSAPLLTMAKLPGAQAAMEKTVAATTAALAGAGSFGAAGSLSADEVFSPVQLLLDRELRDMLQRLLGGPAHPMDTTDGALEAVREGIAAGGFAGADSTLDHYRELCWFPRHMRREMLATWRRLGRPSELETTRQEARERLEGASWVLDEPRYSQLEELYSDACRELAGDESGAAGACHPQTITD